MTKQPIHFTIIAPEMERFHIIAFTHIKPGINGLLKYNIAEETLHDRLLALKKELAIDELMYLSTCNRVEFIFATSSDVSKKFLNRFFSAYNPLWTNEDIANAIDDCQVFSGEEGIRHLFRVASSLDSLVVGEREIITQVRNCYEKCLAIGLTGDLLRLVLKKTIETAKRVYSETEIARKPVSVISLAYRKLKIMHLPVNTHFVLVGAGATAIAMGKFLKKHGFHSFSVYNRTVENGQRLADLIGGRAFPLEKLFHRGCKFNVFITCTKAQSHIINEKIYSTITSGDETEKIIIDLSVPANVDPALKEKFNIRLITVGDLHDEAECNLKERRKEVGKSEGIVEEMIADFQTTLKEREVERMMSSIPVKIKEIRSRATDIVFAKELCTLDSSSRDLVDRMLDYMEKKCISVPMKMAKQVIQSNAK